MCADALPGYQKLRIRVIHMRDNRRGQPVPECNGQASPWGNRLADHGNPYARDLFHGTYGALDWDDYTLSEDGKITASRTRVFRSYQPIGNTNDDWHDGTT
ncbi:hypothetical protein ZHAS_00004410 [Anopheles sinensis]|uniref:Uncharacterized protein n=1 Tax=Anopheles sinensis TaxID=74873 RepID=A0A084VGT5_ANOSI|nr:hypothetical protein ZHAS_00004410 [Anopheles sinensis]